ncbi:MAG: DUF1330 domain-containing protein [Candidatus Zixiibacteriota bacterium]
MAAYVIVDIDVTDPVRYEEYKKLAAPTVAAHGGRYVVRGGNVETLEGDWHPGRLVVLEFPTADQARAWWGSEAYRPAKQIRHATARTKMILVEGV